ncbi:hypothetical protein PGT21_014937 [Puccinia graminis f. sp. tritici]|uniref:Uncharacterized protein n=1 Tax=Puccinia graminis f. sp. tritici TaxID=56615 RepID=A0A5B0LLN2_PUCGR|nr:hypothetical protein PGT21_014937 [Puccinia graminis f. sp. tritici]KAA1068252.1 hypothetical protein PGTUg99_030001 [Puccinia graminis f. sp. tritici]
MRVDSQPISLQEIADQHATLMPRHPQGTFSSTSDIQGRVSSLSRHTASDLAGPERSIATAPNWPRPPSSSSSYQRSMAAAPGSNGRRSAPYPVGASMARVQPGQLARPGSGSTHSISVCSYDESYGCW